MGKNNHKNPADWWRSHIQGWLCPNCGVTWAPWVISCECEKDAEAQVFEAVLEERPSAPPCQQMMNVCPFAERDTAIWDVLINQSDRCHIACAGHDELRGCMKELSVIEEDAPSPLPKYVETLQELRDTQELPDIEMPIVLKEFLRKHPWAAAQVHEAVDRLAGADVEANNA